MLIDNYNHTIGLWISALDHYDFNQLCAKPSPTSWSIGQLYIHLIEDTGYYIEQINLCLATDEYAEEKACDFAQTLFLNNDFPDMAIEGAPSNAFIPQPESIEQLVNAMTDLKNQMNHVAELMTKNPTKGKTKHPGLDYFNANEWLQFAEIHFRHHLRQKKRIDDFLMSFKNA